MKFELSLILVAFGLLLNFSSGVMAFPNVDQLDIAGIVKVLEERDVPAPIIEGVKMKLIARHDPVTVTLTTCITSVPPTTTLPVDVPATSAAPTPPVPSAATPPATTIPGSADPPVTTSATSEVVTCTPATTEPTGTPGTPSSSDMTAPPVPTTPTSEVPATSTGTTTETSTTFSSTETSIVETTTTASDPPASSTPPAVNAAVIDKMDVVAVGLAALAALL